MFQNPYSQHFHQVPNPESPYQGPIPGGMVPGKQIFVGGFVRPHADRLEFNLKTSYGACALHINPRFSENCIVRNTDNNGWQHEERDGNMILQQGAPFEMVIKCDPGNFNVAINGMHSFSYNHRMNFQEIVAFDVNGEMDINKIIFSEGGFNPNETVAPGLPASIPLNNLHPGSLIQITGTVPYDCNRFEVDMQCGPGVQPSEMPFHFNPRFDDPHTSEPVVVRTNCENGSWGPEDRDHAYFPFQKGANFDMLIRCGRKKWKVAVNGAHFVEFPHRQPWQQANTIGISGDVQIHSVKQY